MSCVGSRRGGGGGGCGPRGGLHRGGGGRCPHAAGWISRAEGATASHPPPHRERATRRASPAGRAPHDRIERPLGESPRSVAGFSSSRVPAPPPPRTRAGPCVRQGGV